MKKRKGIVLAGGSGTRLYPNTLSISKQLLPIYDKPMIYYPISVLMLAGIREIAIITTERDLPQFQALLGTGTNWGLEFTYIIQPSPDGLAQAYLLAEEFLDGAPSAMILGDNIFFGHGLRQLLVEADGSNHAASIFGYHVKDPERYGVARFGANGLVEEIVEKPQNPPSQYAITGLYFLDGTAPRRAADVTPSARGELEITSLLNSYLKDGALTLRAMGRGFAWLDTGTHGSLLDAGNFVRSLETRQGLQAGCPEEIAFSQKWITQERLSELADRYAKNDYGRYLKSLLDIAA